MIVYQLRELPEQYKELQLSMEDILSAIGEQHLMTIHRQRSLNTPLLPIWKPMDTTFDDVLGCKSEIPDISIWAGTYLTLTPKAYEVLGDSLAQEGEFLPIKINGEEFQIFNCLSFGQEDSSLCSLKYLDGIEDGLETLYFEESDIKNRLLFKSKLQGCQTLFATEQFKELCEMANLKGLRFDKDLLVLF